MKPVVALAGAIASGKTTLACQLAERWSCPRASFGRLVVHEAAARGLTSDRDTLQALGAALIDDLGWPEFCRRTLELGGADWHTAPLVIDGVRHRAALDTLRARVLGAPVTLVFVTCEPDVRVRRQLVRGVSLEAIRRWETDPTEREIVDLASLAAITVSGQRPVGEAIDRIEQYLGRST